MIRHRPRTRGVAAQHASLSRWRSPVRIRSGPPSLSDPPTPRPPARTGRSPVPADALPPARRRPRSVTAAAPRLARGIVRPVTVRDPEYNPRRTPAGARPCPGGWSPRRGAGPRGGHRARLRRGLIGGGLGAGPRRGHLRRPAPGLHRPPRTTPPVHAGPGGPRRVGRRRLRDAERARPGAAGHGRGGRRDRPGDQLPVGAQRGQGRRRARDRGGRRSPTGRSSSWRSDADAILAALEPRPRRPRQPARHGRERAKLPWRRTWRDTAAALGFLRADEVGPSVRALAWGGKALFGIDRVERPRDVAADRALLGRPRDHPRYDPTTAWTIVAGGDILLDRGVALTIRAAGRRTSRSTAARPRSPGSARTARPSAGTPPYTKRTGNAGRRARPGLGRGSRHRQLREPGPERVLVPRPAGRCSPPTRRTSRGSRTPASTGCRWPTTTSATPGGPGCSRRWRTSTSTGSRTAGLGKNRKAAHKAALLEVGDVTVGILGLRHDRALLQGRATTRPAAPG